MKKHNYATNLRWTGNQGQGTQSYRVYSRDHEINIQEGLHPIMGSSDPSFRGNPARYNPEELLLASLSACHMLWFLHLCSINNIIVVEYRDAATATMLEDETGGGRFTEAVLKPSVTVSEVSMIEKANALHTDAAEKCFIAKSVNFPVRHQAECTFLESN